MPVFTHNEAKALAERLRPQGCKHLIVLRVSSVSFELVWAGEQAHITCNLSGRSTLAECVSDAYAICGQWGHNNGSLPEVWRERASLMDPFTGSLSQLKRAK